MGTPLASDKHHGIVAGGQNSVALPTLDGSGSETQFAPHDETKEEELSVVKSEGEVPLKIRLAALVLILVYSSGAAFAEAILGPLKSTLVKELKLTNAQFSTITAASSVVNTVLPTLGGLLMDYYGGANAALAASACCVVGSIIAASSANTGQVGLLIGGRIIMGLGSIVIETSQNKLYAQWFRGSSLAFVIALDLAWGQLTGMVARLVAVPMSLINGWYGWALWIPVILIVACNFIVATYWVFERAVWKARPELKVEISDKDMTGWQGWRFVVRNITQLPCFFWILCGTEVFQNSARTVYSNNLADMQERTRGTSTLAAGFNSAFQSVIQIVTVPVIGLFFDRVGWRMPFVSIGAALYIVVFALIGLTTVHPLAPIILGSFALAFNVLPFVGSIPVLVTDDTLMGTAYGVWSSFIACNNVIMEIATGAIQDRTPTQSYERVIYFLIAVKAIQVALGPIYDFLDGRLLGHSLRMNEKNRLAYLKAKEESGEPVYGWQVKKWALYLFGGQFLVMVLCSWISVRRQDSST